MAELLSLAAVEQRASVSVNPTLHLFVRYVLSIYPGPDIALSQGTFMFAEQHITYIPSERTYPFKGIHSAKLNFHFPLLKDSLLV